ncbi:MAG: PAS domain-containing protein [Bacteroidia bacterium]|nr:PAS domain-containing protein [Bacteroidia bacterium]MDW8088559.1 PAS domain-containing protein [Bacteroidia bacterium]
MTATLQLRLWGLIFALLIGGSGLLWVFWERSLSEEALSQLRQLREIEKALLRVETAIWLQEARLRASFLEYASAQSIPPTLLRQAEVRPALKALEIAARQQNQPLPLLRELIERVLLLERRHQGWRRALEQSRGREDYHPILEQYLAEAPALLAAVENEIGRFRDYLAQRSLSLLEGIRQKQEHLNTVGWLLVGGFATVALLAFLIVGREESHRFKQALEAIARQRPLPALPKPLQPIGQSYNDLLLRWQQLLEGLEALAASRPLSESLASALRSAAPPFSEVADRLAQQTAQLQTLSAELQKETQRLEALQQEWALKMTELHLQIGALQNLLPIAEIDAQGRFTSKNDLFLELPGAAAWTNLTEVGLEWGQHQMESQSLRGIIQIDGRDYAYALLVYRQDKTRRGLFSLLPLPELRRRLEEAEAKLAALQKEYQAVENAYLRLKQQYSTLQAEYNQEIERLLRQRQSLQTLLKMPALQKGDVLEGLAAIAEVAATLDPEARYSFWVFGDQNGSLHCLEAYDPTLLAHTNSVDLPAEVARWVYAQVGQSPGPYQPETTPLRTYLTQRQFQQLWMFPLLIDEEIAGVFFVERLSDKPLRDAEYPALLARVASLLLQQGHRKLVEQQLISYLEHAQALEEELRQNIEELEASAEEMRRTQAELRGQITALNNAALVAEMNPEGRIIYVNESFLRLFGYKSEDILGQPYQVLRRPEEEPLLRKMFDKLRQGESWSEVVSYTTRWNDSIWLQQTISPVCQSDGEIYKYILVGFDITLQKQQEQEIQSALLLARQQEQLLRENTEELRRSNENYRASQLQLSAQLEALNNAAWLFETDGEGYITYASGSLLEALAHSTNSIVGQHYGSLFSERQPIAVLQGHWRSMQAGQIWKSEVELRGTLGHSYWAIMSSTPLIDRSRPEKKLLKTINILFDITEQKEQEFRLTEQQNALSLLASHPALKEGDVPKAFQVIAEVALATLKAYRVSLWLYEENDQARCVAVAEKEPHSHAVGSVVSRSLYPLYFQSLEREQVIAVVDALSDLRTRELALPLFKPNNVASVMDGIIRVGAKTVGLISVEHRYTKREWRLDEVNFLRALAASAASVIEEEQQAYARRLQEAYAQLEVQKHELEEAMRDIRESIRYAKRMQKNILPSEAILEKYLGRDNFFIIWRPRDRTGVGGDFYWFSEVEDSYFIVVADGTGHGVPGAFMTLIGSILLDHIINKSRIFSPAQILHDLHIGVRQILRQDIETEGITSRDGMDIALVRYFPKTYKLIYAGANLPIYYLSGGELREIKPDKKAIGGEQLEEERFFTEHEIQLEQGDSFFLFTDGVVDQWGGPAGKRFGTKQLKEFILEHLHEPSMPRLRALFNQRWKEWKDYGEDREQVDDVTMWGVRVW